MQTSHSFESYATIIDNLTCYVAGLPGYPRNFSRDTFIAGILAADTQLLNSQIAISSLHQGKKFDLISGEEPGKIHHEYPGVVVTEPYITTYNASDTTALYLIGLEFLLNSKHKSKQFLKLHNASIKRALDYITSHIDNDIFWEYPPQGSEHYSLRVTYWKDSIIPSVAGKKEPVYPVTYALVHFQVARGILAAASMLDRDDLRDLAHVMFITGIEKFITNNTFCVAEDANGKLEQVSSDELHSLAYIPLTYASYLPLKAIRNRAKPLVTNAGIACLPKDISDTLADTYHGYVVWVFEQALISYGAKKFALQDIVEITKRCVPYIGTGQEFISPTPKVAPLGNSQQLWSVAAKIFFSEMRSLRQSEML